MFVRESHHGERDSAYRSSNNFVSKKVTEKLKLLSTILIKQNNTRGLRQVFLLRTYDRMTLTLCT